MSSTWSGSTITAGAGSTTPRSCTLGTSFETTTGVPSLMASSGGNPYPSVNGT